MRKPRLLDLFCGAGGAARGYQRAGFYVVGVDNRPQPRYAGDEFHQADAMTFDLSGYDAIHASPPCQHYSRGATALRNAGREYPDLLGPTRDKLNVLYRERGVPWVIENVPGSPMRADLVLCGSQFGLLLVRHRWFEFHEPPEFALLPACSHDPKSLTVTGHGTPSYVRNSREKRGIAKNYGTKEVQEVMGMPWASRKECSQAIPPAYTEYIGRRLARSLGAQ